MRMEEGKTGELQDRAILKRGINRDLKYLSSKGMISNVEVYNLTYL